MLSTNAFEEELREEYGKIFNNIAEIKAAKKRKLSDKNPCLLPTSYTADKEKRPEAKLLSQASSKQDFTSEATQSNGNIQVECYKDVLAAKRIERPKRFNSKARDKKLKEPSKSLLYDKVAMDLEAVFNKRMMNDLSTVRRNTMDVKKEFQGQNAPRDETQGTQIQYKTVHTKNDTLYIWIASV